MTKSPRTAEVVLVNYFEPATGHQVAVHSLGSTIWVAEFINGRGALLLASRWFQLVGRSPRFRAATRPLAAPGGLLDHIWALHCPVEPSGSSTSKRFQLVTQTLRSLFARPGLTIARSGN